MCDNLETTDHILVHCPIAVLLWSYMRDTLGWPKSCTCCSDVFVEVLKDCQGKKGTSNRICLAPVDHLEDQK